MDRESPEVIEREMEQTRESLTDKVSLLERQVAGTIQSTTDAVHSVRSAVEDTVSAVSGGMKDSVQSVTEGLKDAFDISGRVRKNPLPMVGGSVLAGLITGWIVFRKTQPQVSATPAFVPMASPAAPTPRPAWMSELFEIAGREVKKLAEQAIARASSSVQQSVEEGIPKLIDRAIPEIPPAESRHNGNGSFARR